MFALTATVLLLAGSLALDTARMYALQTEMTQAIDASVLATTKGLTQGDIPLDKAEEELLAYIDANLDGRSLNSGDVVIDNITVDSTEKSLQVAAHTMMPMTMGGLVGYSQQRIGTVSKAKFANTNVEVVMALDITGSMGDPISGKSGTTKISALKTAAKLGIDTLLGTSADGRIRIGLVPYSETVNIGDFTKKIQVSNTQITYCVMWWGSYCLGWKTKTNTSTCVYERSGANRYTDAFANASAKIPLSDDGNYVCPSAQITTLSSNATSLKDKITAYSANGGTAGHIAIAWAYYMLSPTWNSIWPSTAQVQPYGAAGTSKYVIIMTDGEFNTFQTDNIDDTYYSTLYATSLCSSMRTSGIKIYSIAFKAGTAGETLMKSCASQDTDGKKQYYNATDEASLKDAFVAIAQDIQGLRLVN